jgi:hypothetical protein
MENRKTVATKALLYSKLPPVLRYAITGVRLFPAYMQWYLDPSGRRHAAEILRSMKDKFAGCRCIVMGNGPSLRKTNLALLKDEFTFGLNRIYLLFEELGFETDFLCSINRFQFQYYGKEMSSVKGLKIFNWVFRKYAGFDERTVLLSPKLSPNMNGHILNGYSTNIGTVTNLALETAFFLGFSEVALIGVDFSFVETGTPNAAVVLNGADQNHFTPNYYEPGIVWQLPDYETQRRGFRAARKLFDENGRKIVDATVGGKLDVFPKVNFEEYLSGSNCLNKSASQLRV